MVGLVGRRVGRRAGDAGARTERRDGHQTEREDDPCGQPRQVCRGRCRRPALARRAGRCARLRPWTRCASSPPSPERAAIFLDVDGTLAPIVADPADSRVPDATRAELERLAARYALVACVSGRSGERAREIVGVHGLTYVGEHGLELDPEAEAWAPRIHAFAAERRLAGGGQAALGGVPLPDGGRPGRRRGACSRASSARRASEGFRTRWGRLVLEVLPPLDTSKGTAVRRLLETHGLERALYAGDDTTDLDGFAALDGLAGGGAGRGRLDRGPERPRRPRGRRRRLARGARAAAGAALTRRSEHRRAASSSRDAARLAAARRRAPSVVAGVVEDAAQHGRMRRCRRASTAATFAEVDEVASGGCARTARGGSASSSSPSEAVLRYERS